MALEHGFSVVCEKPLATSSRDAAELACLVRETGLLFCVTYAYSGYPLVKHLRDLIAAGEIGEIRFVNGEYPQEWLMTRLEDTGQKQAAWRTDPKLAGISNCVGDIGSHIENMVAYLTGLEIESLCARLDRFGAGRPLDDNATILVDYTGGAKGVYWSSQIAVGHDNALRLRVYGAKGAVEWFQETPNYGPGLLSRPPVRDDLARPRPDVAPGPVALPPPLGPPRGLFRELRQRLFHVHRRPGQEVRGEPLADADLDFPERRRRPPRRPLYRDLRRELG